MRQTYGHHQDLRRFVEGCVESADEGWFVGWKSSRAYTDTRKVHHLRMCLSGESTRGSEFLRPNCSRAQLTKTYVLAAPTRMIQRLPVHPLGRPRPAVFWVSFLLVVHIDDEQELPARHGARLDLTGQGMPSICRFADGWPRCRVHSHMQILRDGSLGSGRLFLLFVG